MSETGPEAGEERDWEAAKRELVADTRDETADERDRIADEREAAADARDAVADQREDELHLREERVGARARDVGLPAEERAAVRAEARQASRAARAAAAQERLAAAEARHAEDQAREQATARRLTEGPPSLLALVFAGIAARLYSAETHEEVLTRIAEAAVATVAGGRTSSVLMVDGTGFRTAASTDAAAAAVDREQVDAAEGPGLDAVGTPMVEAPSFPDERWPVLGAQPTRHGVESSLSYQLRMTRGVDGAAGTGSLNIYAATPAAFDRIAQEVGTILAAHASLAARAVSERDGLQDLSRHLERALLSRDVIGQAKGILMERFKVTPEEAFDMLRRSSQRLNLKLRDVAARLSETGDIP